MTDPDHLQLAIALFVRLRHRGLKLGIGELLAAVQLKDSNRTDADPDIFRRTLERLWCHTQEQIFEFNTVWNSLTVAGDKIDISKDPPTSKSEASTPAVPPQSSQPSDITTSPISQFKSESEWFALPVRAPFTPTFMGAEVDLHVYRPISRRQMSYTWRYLRRLISVGPANVLDVPTTIEHAARQGFFLAPVYRRELRSYAHLFLMIDQGGSMVPFHRFTRDMVETAQNERGLQRVDVVYFNNVPAESVYWDSHLTEPIPLEKILGDCTNETSVLIVSDAGAARGYRRRERIRATTSFLFQLKQHSTLVAWLNPMPEVRWSGTSAQIITYQVPMFPLNPDGFSNAIDIVRGQPLRHYR